MSGILKNTLQSELVRNSARLLSANIVAQAIGLLVYPLLTRLYSPDDFGLLSLFMSIGGVLVILATADYQNAIVLPKREDSAHALFRVCMFIISSVTILLVVSIPFSRPIATLFHTPSLSQWWYLMPVYVFALAGWQAVRNLLLRYKAFRNLSAYQYTQSLVSTGGKLGFGAVGFLSGGLIVASVLGPLVSLCVSVGSVWKRVFRGKSISRELLSTEARAYRNFPIYSLPRTLVNNLSSNLPALMLTPVFGLAEMGFFSMALTLSFLPVNMIVQSVYQVLFQRTTQLVNEGKQISRLLFRYVGFAIAVLLILFVGLYFILPWLTGFLLGDEWRISGEYIRLLLPWLLLMGVTGALTFITDIFHLQRPALFVEISYLLLRIAALTVGIIMHDFRLTIILYSIVSATVIAGQLIWFTVIIRRYEKSL